MLETRISEDFIGAAGLVRIYDLPEERLGLGYLDTFLMYGDTIEQLIKAVAQRERVPQTSGDMPLRTEKHRTLVVTK